MSNMTELIILGSGTCVPSIRRAGPAACLRTGGITILVDSAAGTLRQLLRAGISYDSIDMLLYTHLHPDHVGEFVPFVFATKYAPGFHRSTPVTVIAARGFNAFHAALKDAFGQWVKPDPGSLVVEEMPVEMPAAIQAPPLTIRSAPTVHTAQSLAYRIETPDNLSIVFSGDTDYSPALADLARDADVMVCECAAPEGQKVEGHLVPSEAGRMARDAGVKKLILTHFYPACDQHDLITPCGKFYDGPIILAEDLMRLVL